MNPPSSSPIVANGPARKIYDNPYIIQRILLDLPVKDVQKLYVLEKSFTPLAIEVVGRTKTYAANYIWDFASRHGLDPDRIASTSHDQWRTRVDDESDGEEYEQIDIIRFLAQVAHQIEQGQALITNTASPESEQDQRDGDLPARGAGDSVSCPASTRHDNTQAGALPVPDEEASRSAAIDTDNVNDDGEDAQSTSGYHPEVFARQLPPAELMSPTRPSKVMADHLLRSVRKVRMPVYLALRDAHESFTNTLTRQSLEKIQRLCPNLTQLSSHCEDFDDYYWDWPPVSSYGGAARWSMDIPSRSIVVYDSHDIDWTDDAPYTFTPIKTDKYWRDHGGSTQRNVTIGFYEGAQQGKLEQLSSLTLRPDLASFRIEMTDTEQTQVYDALSEALSARAPEAARLQKLVVDIEGARPRLTAVASLVRACDGRCSLLTLRNVPKVKASPFSHLPLDVEIPPGTCVRFVDGHYNRLSPRLLAPIRAEGQLEIVLDTCNRVGLSEFRLLGRQVGSCLRQLHMPDTQDSSDVLIPLDELHTIIDIVRHDMPVLEALAFAVRSRDDPDTYEDSSFLVCSGDWGGNLKSLQLVIHSYGPLNHRVSRMPWYAIASNLACVASPFTSLSVHHLLFAEDGQYCRDCDLVCCGHAEDHDLTRSREMTGSKVPGLVQHLLRCVHTVCLWGRGKGKSTNLSSLTKEQQQILHDTDYQDLGLYPFAPQSIQSRYPQFDHNNQPIAFHDLQTVDEIRQLKAQLNDPQASAECKSRAERRLKRLRDIFSLIEA